MNDLLDDEAVTEIDDPTIMNQRKLIQIANGLLEDDAKY
eukprot:CAMPEP_0116932536 /NCGR_PEP_ID=MMETSP0467-20121206/28497_1 /TAXON_ID=283647 /ORGANISM="Mesodinium pulex, Strain SPMC105" /LENGTH=38 /DNA_ID= /DNA_START= /DNA_END= /DNA_ORIENTATION=